MGSSRLALAVTLVARYRDLWPRRHKFRRRVSVISSFIVAVKSARVSAIAGKTLDKKANGADLRFSFALSLLSTAPRSRSSSQFAYLRAIPSVRTRLRSHSRPVVFFHARNSARPRASVETLYFARANVFTLQK